MLAVAAACGLPLSLRVDVADPPLNDLNPEYASWNVDPSANRGFFHISFANANLQAAAASLAPSVMRVGGSGADFLVYGLGTGAACPVPSPDNDTFGCLNASHWDELHGLSVAAGAKMLFGASFDLSSACCTGPSPQRDKYSWNASGVHGRGILALLGHAASRQQHIWGLELGNEINNAQRPCPIVFGCECGLVPRQQSDAFLALAAALRTASAAGGAPPVLVGPDTGGFECVGDDCPWLEGVLSTLNESGSAGLLHAATHHAYAGTTAADFTAVKQYERYQRDAAWFLPLVRRYGGGQIQPWAGENGVHGGGEDGSCGAQAICGTYASALWYADELAARASVGFVQHQRQDLVGGERQFGNLCLAVWSFGVFAQFPHLLPACEFAVHQLLRRHREPVGVLQGHLVGHRSWDLRESVSWARALF